MGLDYVLLQFTFGLTDEPTIALQQQVTPRGVFSLLRKTLPGCHAEEGGMDRCKGSF
jgi:hypothetical protein